MFLEVKNLSFQYQTGRPILHGLSFSVEAGQTLAVVGASGCGKSTLLKIIADILGRKDGSVLGGSIKIDGLSPEDYRLSGRLSYMFQEPTLLPHLTVEKNIALPLEITGKRSAEIVRELIEAVGLSEYQNFLPNKLSGGMKTRVSLARSFSTAPELLLLDEPFSALDIAWKDSLYRRLQQLHHRFGTTVILVTHDIEEAIRLAGNNIIILGRKGQQIPYEPALDEVVRKEQIEALIIGDHKQIQREEKINNILA